MHINNLYLSSGGPRLKYDLIMSTVRNTVTDDYMRESYGADFSRVMLKSVLKVRHYWLQISMDEWKGF